MPSVNFEVVWPDGEQVNYYSPSTVVHQHLNPQTSYSQKEFGERTEAALTQASERVYQRFGYYCTSAQGELERIHRKLRFLREQDIQGPVQVNQLT